LKRVLRGLGNLGEVGVLGRLERPAENDKDGKGNYKEAKKG